MAISILLAGNTATGWFSINGRTRPFGQWEYSTNIANAHQLQLMAMDLGASYRLASNIDFSSGLAVGGKYPGMWSATGFSPIGNFTIGDSSTEFAGSLDGQGRVISNLAINLASTNYVGLFGYIRPGGAVSNVSLQAASITGQDRVGILAGYSKGTISNASATGSVTANGLGGGLIGESSGSVANSWAAVTVAGTTPTSSSMGGLVGWSNAGGTIQDSYATGNVTAGTGGTRAGGLTAQSNGSILRSYATGAVSGGSQGVGGLVGFNSGATIVDSYATGAVTATAFAGGLVGFNSSGATIVNSHATGAVTTEFARRWTGRHQRRGSFHRQVLRNWSGQRHVVDHRRIDRRWTGRQQLRSHHQVLCDRGRQRYVHLCSGHGYVGGRADRHQR